MNTKDKLLNNLHTDPIVTSFTIESVSYRHSGIAIYVSFELIGRGPAVSSTELWMAMIELLQGLLRGVSVP
jgi:hypothetical protein